MKIILLEDIPNLGVVGDVVDVKRGYANNYLLKKNRAIPGTKENLEKAEEIRLEQAKIQAENEAAAQALAELLNETEIEIAAKAGDSGKLFGSITKKDIADALKEQKEITVDRKKIILNEPIREIGQQEIVIRPFHNIEANLKVNIVEE